MSYVDAFEGYLVLALILALIGGFVYQSVKDSRRGKTAPAQLNLSGLAARSNIRLVRSLLLGLLLLQAGHSLALDTPATIPYREPHLTEHTILPLVSPALSRSGLQNESLACDQAHTRAMHGLREQIARARTRGQIDTNALISFDTLEERREWSSHRGRCAVTLSLTLSDVTWKPVRHVSTTKRF